MRDAPVHLSLPATRMSYLSWPFSFRGQQHEDFSALCLGWCASDQNMPAWLQVATPLPSSTDAPVGSNTLLHFDHQYGGYACLQLEFLGLVFPLVANRQHLPEEGAMLRALDLMGHGDRDRAVAKELHAIAPVLVTTWLTSGQDFDPGELAAWRALLQRWLPGFGALRWGGEATLSLADTDLTVFQGWQVLSAALDDERLACEAVPVQDAHFHALREVGERLGVGAPGLWLLWDNSD